MPNNVEKIGYKMLLAVRARMVEILDVGIYNSQSIIGRRVHWAIHFAYRSNLGGPPRESSESEFNRFEQAFQHLGELKLTSGGFNPWDHTAKGKKHEYRNKNKNRKKNS